MKTLILISTLLFAQFTFAGWTEEIRCNITRADIDSDMATQAKATADIVMSGPHNGESGSVLIKHPLFPSYQVKFSLHTSGRNAEYHMRTRLGKKTVALASSDEQIAGRVVNTFMTSDYQFTIRCRSALQR